jgi:putative Mn2+ efflux pump MntP
MDGREANVNRIQKISVFGIVMGVLIMLSLSYVFLTLFHFKVFLPRATARILPLILFTFMGLGIFWIRKKQSPAEPVSDERDDNIQRTAAVAAFVGTLIIWGIVLLLLTILVGVDFNIPLWAVTLGSAAMGEVALTIYLAAILIQYGRAG